jgi:hypothetical protein
MESVSPKRILKQVQWQAGVPCEWPFERGIYQYLRRIEKKSAGGGIGRGKEAMVKI